MTEHQLNLSTGDKEAENELPVLSSEWALKAIELLTLLRIEGMTTKIAEDSFYVRSNPSNPQRKSHFVEKSWSPLGVLKLGEEIKWSCHCGAEMCVVSAISENASSELLRDVGIECLKCADLHVFSSYSQYLVAE